MKKTEQINLGVYCNEELLLMDILGNKELKKAINKELDRRALIGMELEAYQESQLALVS